MNFQDKCSFKGLGKQHKEPAIGHDGGIAKESMVMEGKMIKLQKQNYFYTGIEENPKSI